MPMQRSWGVTAITPGLETLLPRALELIHNGAMKRAMILVPILVCALGACSDKQASHSTAVNGSMTPVGGGTPPSSAKAVVLWTTDAGQGDSFYKYGEGPATATSFSLSIDEPLPTEATLGGILSVGIAVLIPSSVSIPNGVVTDPNFGGDVLGLAGQYAIIYRVNSTPTGLWVDQFPDGVSCGQCVPATTGFDTFTPVPCNLTEMQVGPISAITVCNWT
jgi:hypothetical protein